MPPIRVKKFLTACKKYEKMDIKDLENEDKLKRKPLIGFGYKKKLIKDRVETSNSIDDKYILLHDKQVKDDMKNFINSKKGAQINDKDLYCIHSFLKDEEEGLRSNVELDIRIKTPCSVLLSGKSKCGKTTLLIDILSQWRNYTDDEDGKYFRNIYWFYGTESPEDFYKMNNIVNSYNLKLPEDSMSFKSKITFVKGDLTDTLVLDKINSIPHYSIVILDDMMNEMTRREDVSNILTREAHHKNWCVFMLWQYLHPEGRFARQLVNQVDYKFIFQDPARSDQLRAVINQMYPGQTGEARTIFNTCQRYFSESKEGEYPYVRICARPNVDNRLRFIVNSLIRNPENVKIAYPDKAISLLKTI